jgi:hypothetical protein
LGKNLMVGKSLTPYFSANGLFVAASASTLATTHYK